MLNFAKLFQKDNRQFVAIRRPDEDGEPVIEFLTGFDNRVASNECLFADEEARDRTFESLDSENITDFFEDVL